METKLKEDTGQKVRLPNILVMFFLGCFLIKGQPQITTEVPIIILDTDMGSDCDDVGALAILHQYMNERKAELLGCIYSSGQVPFGVGIIDAINTYYGRPNLPIGAEQNSNFGDPVDKMDAEKLAQDTHAFGHTDIRNNDVPDQVALLRKLLVAQHDTSVTYVTIGHTKALHDLLRSLPDTISEKSGADLVAWKVKKWVALGGLGANKPDVVGVKDWNFFRNGSQPYTDYLLEYFPRPIYVINAGGDVVTGQVLEFSERGNIVRAAYLDWLWKTEKKLLREGRPSWDLAAVCFAVQGSTLPFFERPESGTLHFDITHGSRWESNRNGPHFYVNQKEGVENDFADYLNGLLGISLGMQPLKNNN